MKKIAFVAVLIAVIVGIVFGGIALAGAAPAGNPGPTPTPTPTPVPTPTPAPPTLILSPSSGAVGTNVKVDGENWLPKQAVTIVWIGVGIGNPTAFGNGTVAVAMTNPQGKFNTHFRAPQDPPGSYVVLAFQTTLGSQAEFTIK